MLLSYLESGEDEGKGGLCGFLNSKSLFTLKLIVCASSMQRYFSLSLWVGLLLTDQVQCPNNIIQLILRCHVSPILMFLIWECISQSMHTFNAVVLLFFLCYKMAHLQFDDVLDLRKCHIINRNNKLLNLSKKYLIWGQQRVQLEFYQRGYAVIMDVIINMPTG